MPVPAVVGFAALITFLGSVISGLVTWVVTFFSRRIVLITLVITVILAAIAGLHAALEAALLQITVSAPPIVSQAIGMVIPANAPIVISVVANAHVVRWVYDWKVKTVKMKAKC